MENEYTTMGARIKQALDRAKISQRKLSQALNITEPSVSASISGKSEPSASGLATISRLTGVSIDWIILGDQPGWDIDVNASSNDSDKPVTVAINGGSAHIDVHHHGVNEDQANYGIDQQDRIFLQDWHRLSKANRMRYWGSLLEEIEKLEVPTEEI